MKPRTGMSRVATCIAVAALLGGIAGCARVPVNGNSTAHASGPTRTSSGVSSASTPKAAMAHATVAKFTDITPAETASMKGPSRDLTDVHFLNAEDGFGVTGTLMDDRSSIVHTTDGGKTWSVVGKGPGNLPTLSWSGDLGVATGGVSTPSGPSVKLAVTRNNGASWTIIKPHLQTATGMGVAGQLSAHVTANHDIWLLVSPQAATTGGRAPVWVSHDGGHSFQLVPLPSGDIATGGFSAHGYVALSVYNTRTHRYNVLVGDGHMPWAELGPNTTTPIYAVDYVDTTDLYAGGGNLAKYGGQPAQEIWALHPDHPQNVRVVLKRNVAPHNGYQPIVALDMQPGGLSYMITGGIPMGGNLPAPGALLTSVDGGVHVRQTPAVGTSFAAIGSRVWVAGNAIGLDVSTDAGHTWHMNFRPTSVVVESVQFLNRSVGYVVTQVGVYGTTDGGVTWDQLPIPFPAYGGEQLDAVTPTHMYKWSQTDVAESNDGGRTWQSIHLPPIEQIDGFSALPGGVLKLSVLPPPQAYETSFHDDLFTSTDDGAHWTVVPNPFHTQGVALDFTSPEDGMARAPKLMLKTESHPASLYVTKDGGQHWKPVSPALAHDGANTLSANQQGFAIGGEDGSSVNATGQNQPVGRLLLADKDMTQWRAVNTGTNLPDSISYPELGDLWLTANGCLYHSTDGGRTFREVLVAKS